MLRGKATALAVIMLLSSVGYVSLPGLSGQEDPHAPIEINGDSDLQSNACACIRSGSGTQADPFIISDWKIHNGFGPAIEVNNVRNTYFIIRDNTLSGTVGVRMDATGDRGQILQNSISFMNSGVETIRSGPRVVGNTIQGPQKWWGDNWAAGISIRGGSPYISDNLVARGTRGILAQGGSPVIEDNEIVQNYDGLLLTDSTQATLKNNTIRLAGHWGLLVDKSAKATLIGNEIREGEGGIIVNSAHLYMESNRVINQRQEAVRFHDSVVTMFRNNITDNWMGAHGSKDSDVLIKENTFRNNQDTGIRLLRSEGVVEANTVELNGLGIMVDDSILTLKDNVLNNNTFGFSLPYQARQSIPLMSGNVVNGVNVDGTMVPSERRIFYKAAGVTLSGQTIDSGHSDGYFGTTIKEGAVLVYDSVDVTIEHNTFAYNHRAIYVKNSQFVSIQNNTFRNNDEAVVSENSRTFIKDNECIIEVDPPDTICFEADGNFVTVRANVIANVEVGIWFRGHQMSATEGIIEANAITGTKVAVRVGGHPTQDRDDVIVRFNTIEKNKFGIQLIGFHGTLLGNTVGNNSRIGIELRARTNATLENNHVLFNAEGIVDTNTCSEDWRSKCSGGVFVDNVVRGNAGVGIETHNGGTFRGGLVADNEVGIKTQGRAAMDGITVRSNQRVGVDAQGHLVIRHSNTTHNGHEGVRMEGLLFGVALNSSENRGDGVDVTGRAHLRGGALNNNSRVGADIKGSASLAHGNFSGNIVAGLRLNVTTVRLFDCDVSFNGNGILMAEAIVDVHVGLPSVTISPEVPDRPNLPDLPDREEDADPLWMSECDLVANQGFAVRASVESVVNATFNFWGKKGPVIDTQFPKEENRITANVVASPYWTSRDHDGVPAVLPRTALGPEDLA